MNTCHFGTSGTHSLASSTRIHIRVLTFTFKQLNVTVITIMITYHFTFPISFRVNIIRFLFGYPDAVHGSILGNRTSGGFVRTSCAQDYTFGVRFTCHEGGSMQLPIHFRIIDNGTLSRLPDATNGSNLVGSGIRSIYTYNWDTGIHILGSFHHFTKVTTHKIHLRSRVNSNSAHLMGSDAPNGSKRARSDPRPTDIHHWDVGIPILGSIS